MAGRDAEEFPARGRVRGSSGGRRTRMADGGGPPPRGDSRLARHLDGAFAARPKPRRAGSMRHNLKMPDDAPLSFEAGLQQLEAIVKEMESGELPLERALELFERGMKLSESC